MKKFWSIVATIVLVVVLGISILPVKTTAANTTFTNQKCGDGTYASLDANGVLTISGTGNTWDFRVEGDIYSATYGDAPWANCKDAINKVVFTEKVTYIGAEAFCGCINLKEVTFNESMQRIGNFVFMGC